jgi:hypothetical protein
MISLKTLALTLTLSIGASAFAEGLTAEDVANGVSEFATTNEVCFRDNFIRDFDVIDRKNVVIEARRNERYNINLYSCWNLDQFNAIAFRSRLAGSSRICRGDDLLVVDAFPPHRVQEICRIKSITRAQ